MITYPSLQEAVRFFYQHAGWSYNPATETPTQGRMRCARILAGAEHWALAVGLRVEWRDDWSCGSHVEEYDAYAEEPATCQWANAILRGESLAALGCIDDADENYRRVVEAELAYEAKTGTELRVLQER